MRDPKNWTAGSGPVRARPVTYSGEKKATLVAGGSKKWARLATVVLYVLSVCLAAAVLAIYYSLIWKPTTGPGGHRTEPCPADRQHKAAGSRFGTGSSGPTGQTPTGAAEEPANLSMQREKAPLESDTSGMGVLGTEEK